MLECWNCGYGKKLTSNRGNPYWFCKYHGKPGFIIKRQKLPCYQYCRDHEFRFNDYCGAFVCVKCDQHSVDPEGKQLLAQCFCGWRAKDSDYSPGEPLEDEVET